ncbi:MAG: cupin domain-containing protein [Myxococcota bacterium]
MLELRRSLPLGAAFVLGACAATAVQSSASTPTDSQTTAAAEPTDEASSVMSAVVGMSDAPKRVAPNGKARVTMLAQGHNAFLARLDMDAGAAVPEHRDATEEYIHVLEGSGTIMIDDREYALSPGSTVFMAADAKVSFQNGDAPFVGIQVFAGPGPAAKYDAWTSAP